MLRTHLLFFVPSKRKRTTSNVRGSRRQTASSQQLSFARAASRSHFTADSRSSILHLKIPHCVPPHTPLHASITPSVRAPRPPSERRALRHLGLRTHLLRISSVGIYGFSTAGAFFFSLSAPPASEVSPLVASQPPRPYLRPCATHPLTLPSTLAAAPSAQPRPARLCEYAPLGRDRSEDILLIVSSVLPRP